MYKPYPKFFSNIIQASYEIFVRPKTKNNYKTIRIVFISLIVVSTTFSVFNTLSNLSILEHLIFLWLEFIFGIMFFIEYILSIVSIYKRSKGKTPLWRIILRIKYILNLIGTLSFILPVFLDVHSNSGILYGLRLLRILTLISIINYPPITNAWNMIFKAFYSKRNELLIILIIVVCVLLLSASGIYTLEHNAQPEKFGSVFKSLWWAIITMSTIGYGDMIPITVGGKIFASFIAVTGILIISIPGSILTLGLMDTINTKSKRKSMDLQNLLNQEIQCPHCQQQFLLKESMSSSSKKSQKKSH